MAFPQTILPIMVEAYFNGQWNDITQWVDTRGEDGITITYGRPNEGQATEPGRMTLNLNNRDGRWSPRNPNGPYFGQIGRNTPIRASVTGYGSLVINAASGTTPTTANVRTPDTAALDIVGDIDIRVDLSLDGWQLYSQEVVSKWTEAGNQRSYMLSAEYDGRFRWAWSADGINTTGNAFSSRLPVTTGRLAVRMTFDVDNGLGGRKTTWYTAPSIAGPWTQLSSNTGTSTTSIFSGSGIVYVLDNPSSSYSTSIVHGRVYAAQIYNGIAGTLVANPDFTAQAEGATSFADSTGKTWTLSGDVALTNKDIRAAMEVTTWPQKWDTTGVDVWVPAESSGALRRLGQGKAPVQSTIRSGILGRSTTVAYWPLEDEAGASSAASGIANGLPMNITSPASPPTFAADNSFDCSKPLVITNNGTLSGGIVPYISTGKIGIQFLMLIPTGGVTNNGVILRLNTSGGTIRRWDLKYGTGGTLSLDPYDFDGVLVAGGIFSSFNVDGKLLRVSVELVTSGSSVISTVATLEVGAATGLFTTATFTSKTIGAASRIQIDPTRNIDDATIGHISVDSVIPDLYAAYQELNAYRAETAGRRIERLCGEKGLEFVGLGDLDETVPMGPQLPTAFLDLIQECVDVDRGTLFEPRYLLGLGYLPRSAMYLQPADLQLTYTSKHLSTLEPVEDDQLIRNDITGTRPSGSSYRATLPTGRMSTQEAPNGIGVYDTSVSLNVSGDDALEDVVGWLLRLGTIDEARYPVIDVDLARSVFASDSALTAQAVTLDVGGRITIASPPAWLPPELISQVVSGYTEVIGQYTRRLSLSCVPSAPYDTVGLWQTTATTATGLGTISRYSSDGTVVGAPGLTTTGTTLFLDTASGPLWITTTAFPDDFPIPIMIEGELMSIDAITSASNQQPATVTRSLNGVVKAHAVGAAIDLYPISYYAL